MTLQELIDQTNGQYVEVTGPDNKQCTAIPHKWEIGLGLPIVYGHAKDTYANAPDELYEKTLNILGDTNNFPRPGAIIVWDGRWGYGYGHTAVVTSADGNTFHCLEQNDGDYGLTHIGEHNYADVLGWFFPRVLDVPVTPPAPPAPAPEPTPVAPEVAPAPVVEPTTSTTIPGVASVVLTPITEPDTQTLPVTTVAPAIDREELSQPELVVTKQDAVVTDLDTGDPIQVVPKGTTVTVVAIVTKDNSHYLVSRNMAETNVNHGILANYFREAVPMNDVTPPQAQDAAELTGAGVDIPGIPESGKIWGFVLKVLAHLHKRR